MARRTRESLLHDVIESPDDDAPRLAYADFLKRNGEKERAEFIRVQCTLAEIKPDDARRSELESREKELLDEFGWDWAEEFGLKIYEWVFRRGFIERIETWLERPADRIRMLLAKAPIRHIRDTTQFCDLSGVVDALPHLKKLTGLEFWGMYDVKNSLVGKILTSPHLRNLRTLILHHDRNGNLVKDNVLIAGLNSPHRKRLEELAVNVDGCWSGPSNAVLKAIAESPHLRNLRKLNISCIGDRVGLDAKTIHSLARSPNLQKVEELDLRACRCDQEICDALLELAKLPRLQFLRMAGTTLRLKRVGKDIATLPKVRKAFEACGPRIDWDTRSVSPWDRNCWVGISWEARKLAALFAIQPFVRNGDFDGLLRHARQVCRRLDGSRVATTAAKLDFSGYAAAIDAGLKDVIPRLRRRGAKSLFLRIRDDIAWDSELHGQHSDPSTDQPYEEHSYPGPVVEVRVGEFPEPAALCKTIPRSTQPNGVHLYLIARTIATFAECLKRNPVPLPVYFGCMRTVFRMQ
ncbi:MAG: TIGR02996 domain-containing protein [Planctomycetaceae bacterium]|nr:TIGR02996 domain-containing protein [Planctomycetaceae bacterium]